MTLTHNTLIRLRDKYAMTHTAKTVKYSVMANRIIRLICNGTPNYETKAHCDYYNNIISENINTRFNTRELGN